MLQIHADLAPDGSVRLGEQRRGKHVPAKPARVGRRGEPGHVGDHASPERDDDFRALHAPFRPAVAERSRALRSLGSLPGGYRDHARIEPGALKAREKGGPVEPRHRAIGDHQEALRRARRAKERPGAPEKSRAHADRVPDGIARRPDEQGHSGSVSAMACSSRR